jgi:hypothetical protein
VPERVSPAIAADPGFALPAGSNQHKGLQSHWHRDPWLDKLLTTSVSNVGIFVGTLLQKDGK